MAGDMQDKFDRVVTETTQFSDLSEAEQEWVLDRRNIIFQGNETSLRELLTPLSKFDLNDIITSDVLLQLSKGEKITVGKKVESLTKTGEYYMPRFVRKLHTYDDEVISENKLSQLDRYTVGDLTVIGDIPGAGKSTFLANLASVIKNKHPELWVLKIDLSIYSESFWKFKKDNLHPVTLLDLVNSREESRIINHLERKIFSIPGKVVVILDGVNEILPECKGAVLDIIQECQRKNRNDYYEKYTKSISILSGSVNLQREMDLELSHKLEPLLEKDKVRYLQEYWKQKFGLSEDKKKKCEIYAETVVKKLLKKKEKFVGTPLILRMIAEILEHRENFNENFEGCYDFLNSGNVEPKLPKELTLTELYQLYIHKNCSANARSTLNSLRNDIININLNCDRYLQILALESILDEKQCKYFGFYRTRVEKISDEKLSPLQILKRIGKEYRYIHRTFAEYFLAESISNELSQSPNEDFHSLFFDEALVQGRFKLVRKFLDSLLKTDLDIITKETFKILGSSLKERDYDSLLYIATTEGLLNVLKLLLKCSEAADVNIDLNNIAEEGNNGIFDAAESGYYLIVKYFVENCFPIDSRNTEDCTLLHLAAKAGSFEMVKLLIERGLAVDYKDGKGRTPLHRATKRGSIEMVEYLLKHGAYVNSRTKWGYTPLHIAAELGDFDKVKLLVENGAGVEYRGLRSGTVISTAILGGNMDVVKYLVEKGADVRVRNRSGGTMLQLLPKWNDDTCDLEKITAMCQFLIDRGVDVNSVNDYGETVLHTAVKSGYKVEFLRFLVNQGVNINAISNYSETALSNAIRVNRVDMVEYLIENGAEFNVNHDQDRVIYDAVNCKHYEMVKYLAEKNVINASSLDGSTLCCAVRNNDLKMVKLLVENGAKVKGVEILEEAIETCNLKMIEYLVEHGAETEIDFAEVSSGNFEVIKYLVENGAKFKKVKDVENNLELLKYLFEKEIDVDDSAILLKAAEHGFISIVKFLVEKGVDVGSKTQYGSTPLYWAAKYNHIHVVKYLLEQGADVNAKDGTGNTPLYSAAGQGSLEAVKILVENGADVKNATNKDENLLREAVERGYIDTVKYLIERGAPLEVKVYYTGTVLLTALICEQYDIVEFLLGRDAEFTWKYEEIVKRLLPSEYDSDQEYNAVSSVFCTVKKIRYLLGKGLNIDSEVIDKLNILLTAVKGTDLKLVKNLIEKGCNINVRNCYGRTALHDTVDLNMAKILVQNGADVNAKDDYGCSVLCRAVDKTNLDFCKFLVENGAEVGEEDETGQTLLHLQIYDYGNISPDKIKYLIEKGAKLKLTKNGRSVLHDVISTSHRDLDLIKFILGQDIDINCCDDKGVTPLDEAVIAGDLDIVRLLIENGAKIENIKDVVLFRAVENYHHGDWDNSLDMVKFLVGQGANVNARDEEGRTLLHKAVEGRKVEIVKYLVSVGAEINSLDHNGHSALHVACGGSDLSLIKYLIQNGATVDVKNSKGRTLLHEAAHSGSLSIVKFLVEGGSDVTTTDRDGSTPLHEISKSWSDFGSSETYHVAKFLLEKGAKLDAKTRKGFTPLHEASTIKALDKVKLFVENGADINAKDEYGRTPLFSTILGGRDEYGNGSKDVVEFLVKSGADLTHRADNQRTALHEAAIKGDLELVELLVRLGAEVNAKTGAGRTPLHDAARRGMLEVVEFLVKEGAEVEAKTKQGTTALDEATKGEHTDVVEFFTQRNVGVDSKMVTEN